MAGLNGGKTMRDMQYKLAKFSAPASWHTSELKWDFAFLTKEEFIAKWGKTPYEFAQAGQIK
jgi:hypothetical protein